MSEVGNWLKIFFGLPFLPADEIADTFSDCLMPDAAPIPEVQLFCDYMLETYIAPDSLFPPRFWAASPNEHLIRTTNAAESFHRHVKDVVGRAHPNVYNLTNILLKIPEETYIKIQSNDSASSSINSALFMAKTCYSIYANGQMSAKDYLKRICFKYLPVQ